MKTRIILIGLFILAGCGDYGDDQQSSTNGALADTKSSDTPSSSDGTDSTTGSTTAADVQQSDSSEIDDAGSPVSDVESAVDVSKPEDSEQLTDDSGGNTGGTGPLGPGDVDQLEDTSNTDTQSTPDVPAVSEPEPGAIPAGTWNEVAGSLTQSLSGDIVGNEVALAFDLDENPVIAFTRNLVYADGANCPEEAVDVYLTRLVGDQWMGVEKSSPGFDNVSALFEDKEQTRYAYSPSIAVYSDGGFLLAWTSSTSCKLKGTGGTVMVVRYQPGKGWFGVGDDSTSTFGITGTNYNYGSRVALDAQDRAVATYITVSPGGFNGFVNVRRFEDNKWLGLGGSGDGKGISDGDVPAEFESVLLDIAFSPTAEPVVGWATFDVLGASLSGSKDYTSVLMKHWDGQAWQQIDGSGQAPGIAPVSVDVAYEMSMATTSAGRVHMAWTNRWTGTVGGEMPLFHSSALPGGQWVPNDGGGEAGVMFGLVASGPSLTMAFSDRPVVAFTTHQKDAASGSPNDGIGMLAYYPSEGTWKPVAETVDIVAPTATHIPPVSLVGTDKKLGMAWVQTKGKGAGTKATVHYMQYP